MKKSKLNPKLMELTGTIITLIGIAFLLYWTRPIGLSEEWKELTRILVVSIGIPLCLINMGMIYGATGVILKRLDQKDKESEPSVADYRRQSAPQPEP